ncbi:MAG: class I SAM-dependent methyltransferase [Candidatus Kariarchaeaceae archaeon]|jgi:hypothetical protein
MRNYDRSITKWLIDQQDILKDDIKLPADIETKSELTLVALLGLWLCEQEAQVDNLKDCTSILQQHFLGKNSDSLHHYFQETFRQCSDIPVNKIKRVNSKWLQKDHYGTWLQHSLQDSTRKGYAVNYTSRSEKLLDYVMPSDLSAKSIIDPFAGSARLITALLSNQNIRDIKQITINDVMPVGLVLGYCRVVQALKKHEEKIVLEGRIGDAFDITGTYSLVVMNPPFTRSHHISKQQREKFKNLNPKLLQFTQGQAGLHVWSIYFADTLLGKNGTLISVIPSSTILSRYSAGVHHLLLNDYATVRLYSSEEIRSFSEDSDWRELVLVAQRNKSPLSVTFSTIIEDKLWQIGNFNQPSVKELQDDWNWDRYFRDSYLLKFRRQLLQQGKLISGKSAELAILRGIEMYGPNFFFFPNKFWEIEVDERIAQIYNEQNVIVFPRSYLVKVLRKPMLYAQRVTPLVHEFSLSLSTEEPLIPNIQKYIELNSKASKVAQQRFGDEWLYHTKYQLKTKKPYGHLFLVDKLGIGSTSVLSHYLDEKIACTKNFYVIQLGIIRSKLLSAWFNSTLFLGLYLATRREIGGTYGRMQIIDYLEEPLFPKKLMRIKLDNRQVQAVLQAFDDLRHLKLPPLPQQLSAENRMQLDITIAKLIGFKGDLQELHDNLDRIIRKLTYRDKSKSRR